MTFPAHAAKENYEKYGHEGRTLRQSPVHLQPEKRTPLSRTDRLSITALAAVTLLYGGIKYGNDVVNAFEPSSHHKYTNEQLRNMQQQQEVVKPGEGARDEVLRVDPQLENDAQGLSDVEGYVHQQGLGANHQLLAHQAVLVPVIKEK